MKKGDNFLTATRISLGLIFIWAFFDKLFGLGFATAKEAAVINGGSPTLGFLKFGTTGPFTGIFKAMAGSVTVDILFMAGLFFIGFFLILGIMKKTITTLGAILMFLMWSATLLPEHHPFLDEHIIYGLILLYLGTQKWKCSLEKKWLNLKLVKKYNFLK